MHGWDLDVKKRRNFKYAEMEVCSLFKYIVILRKRENLTSVLLEIRVIYFSIWEAHIDNSKSN